MPADMFDPKNTKSIDYRTVYTNTVGLQFNGLELQLRFGILHNAADESAGAEQQVNVVMGPVTAKSLAYTLQAIIENFEALNNSPIPVNPQVEEMVKAVTAQAAAAAAKAKAK